MTKDLNNTGILTFRQAWTRILEQVEAFQDMMKNSGITRIEGSCVIARNQPPSCDVDKLRGFAGNECVELESCSYGGHHPDMISYVKADGAIKMNVSVVQVENGQTISMRQAVSRILENISSYMNATSEPFVGNQIYQFDFDEKNMNDIGILSENDGLTFWEAPEDINTFRQLNNWLKEEMVEIGEFLTSSFVEIVRERIDRINRVHPGLDLSACMQDRIIGVDYGIEFTFLHNGERVNSDDMKKSDLENIAPGLAMTLWEIRSACRDISWTVEVDRTSDRHIRSQPVVNNPGSSESEMGGMGPS